MIVFWLLVLGMVIREAAEEVERPGSDEQWTDLADAMRRYRKHKHRGGGWRHAV